METKINNRWSLKLPEHRAKFHETHPDWEAARIQTMAKFIKPNMTVVDIGAECGDYSALFAMWVGNKGNIILVEAVAKMWPTIKEIWDMNNLKAPSTTFVGFASDKQYYGNDTDTEHYGMQTYAGWPPPATDRQPIIEPGFQSLVENTALPQLPLDIIIGNTKVDILNCDAEGSEYHVFLGCQSILQRDKPTVFVSLHKDFMQHDYGYAIKDFHQYMHSLGYTNRTLAIDHEQHEIYEHLSRIPI